MREIFIPMLLHVSLLAAGAGVLVFVAFPVPRGAGLVGAAGLAYLCGVAVVGTLMIAVVAIGIPFRLRVVLALAFVLSLPALLRLWRRIRGTTGFGSPTVSRENSISREGIAVAVMWSAVAVALLWGLLLVHTRPIEDWDSWAIWTLKAEFLTAGNALPTEAFTSQAYEFANPDYPILLPLFEAMHFRAIGRVDTSEVHVVLWLLLAAWLGGMAHLTRGVLRSVIAAPMLIAAGILLIPQLLTGYADVPVALFLSSGGLALGRWLVSSSRPDLILAMVLLGGATGMKNEGILGACGLLVAAAVALSFERQNRRRLSSLALAGGLMIVCAVLPWRLWLLTHDVSSNFRMSDALNPVFLSERADRLWPALKALVATMGNVATAGVFVAPAVALMVRARGLQGTLVCFYATAGMVYFSALLWVYWTSPFEIHWHLTTSVTRVYLGLAMICFAAFLHLGGVGSVPFDRAPGEASPASSSRNIRATLTGADEDTV